MGGGEARLTLWRCTNAEGGSFAPEDETEKQGRARARRVLGPGTFDQGETEARDDWREKAAAKMTDERRSLKAGTRGGLAALRRRRPAGGWT